MQDAAGSEGVLMRMILILLLSAIVGSSAVALIAGVPEGPLYHHYLEED
ncbi:hypothetical protein [Aquibium oceanicum]